MRMNDYFVDGHFISARTEDEARKEAKRLYDHDAELIRPWRESDDLSGMIA